MLRSIVLKKEATTNNIIGFFITEEESKNRKITTIKRVEGNTITKHVKYLETEILKDLHANETINKYIDEGYKLIKDSTTESKPTGFRVIDNLTHQVTGSYNWN